MRRDRDSCVLTNHDKKYFSRLRLPKWSGLVLWAAPLAMAVVAIVHVYLAFSLAAGAGHSARELLMLWVNDRGLLETYLGFEVRALLHLERAFVYVVLATFAFWLVSSIRRDARVATALQTSQAVD